MRKTNKIVKTERQHCRRIPQWPAWDFPSTRTATGTNIVGTFSTRGDKWSSTTTQSLHEAETHTAEPRDFLGPHNVPFLSLFVFNGLPFLYGRSGKRHQQQEQQHGYSRCSVRA